MRRADGTLILRSPQAPRAADCTGFAGAIGRWAARRADVPAFCERDAQGAWRRITWAGLWQQVQAVGAALLEMGLGQGRPLVVLSPNSLEQLVLLLAAEYVGVPVAPVSPAYSLLSQDFARLKGVCELVPPSALFVQDAATFERAIAALAATGNADIPVIAVRGAKPGQVSWDALSATELTPGGGCACGHPRRRRREDPLHFRLDRRAQGRAEQLPQSASRRIEPARHVREPRSGR
jgi:feruloyl-CoA synthase